MTWTEERVTHLLHLWGNGVSMTAISQMMKLSRSSVAGKLHRLGVMGQRKPYIKKRKSAAKPLSLERGRSWDEKLFEPYAHRKLRKMADAQKSH